MPDAAPPHRIEAPWLTAPERACVFAALAAQGHIARAVGGAIRNALLGVPVADVDIATTATPQETIAAARAAGLKALPTGIAHGTVTIVVDGSPHEVNKGTVTYAEVVTLAYADYPQHPEITYSVTYKRGPNENHEGTLAPGGSVMVKDGMVFNVSRTGQS